jgi:hypothetical protein
MQREPLGVSLSPRPKPAGYFPQDGWRAIGRNAKELNPELRHRLGVNRYSSRGIQAERLARLARNRQRDPVPLSRHRVGTGLMFAPARLRIGGRAEVENERVHLRLCSLKSLAPAT